VVQWDTEGGQLEEKLTEAVRVRVTPTLKAQIEKQAQQDRRKPSDLIRLILERALTPPPETDAQQAQGG